MIRFASPLLTAIVGAFAALRAIRWPSNLWRWLLLGSCFVVRNASFAAEPPAAPPPKHRVVLIPFDFEIDSLSEQSLYRKLDAARKLKPDTVIIEITSPGGRVDATLAMAERLRDIDWARTIAYVPKEALSGGAILALGCDEILVGPQALYGDAGPIFMDKDFLFRHASEKFRSHLVEAVRSLAVAKHRAPALAEAMVDMSVVVFEVRNRVTGEVTFMSDAEIDSSPNVEDWEKLNEVFESREGHFLEVRGHRAVDLKLAAAVVDDRETLRKRFEPAEEWHELPTTRLDLAVMFLNHGWVTALLVIVGLIAFYVELASPGISLGGLVALLCFGLYFWSRFLGGTAEWLEVLLFLAGIALLMIEIFVIPGFGIWGITGVVLLVGSLVLASQTFLVPQTKQDLHDLVRMLTITLLSLIGFGVAATYITRRLGRIPILRNIMLEPPNAGDEIIAINPDAPITESRIGGRWVRVGDRGRTESPLRPAGRIRLANDDIDVVSDGAFIDAGEWVEVIDVRANRVVVRLVEP